MNMYKHLIAVVILLIGSTQILSFIGGRSIGPYAPESSDLPSVETSASEEQKSGAPAIASPTLSAPDAEGELSEDAKRALQGHYMVLKYMTAKVGLEVMRNKIDVACGNRDKPDAGEIANNGAEMCKQEKTLQQSAIRDVLRDPDQKIDPADRDMLIKYLTEILV